MANRLNPGQPRDSQRTRLYTAEHSLRGLRVSAAARRHLTDSVRHEHLVEHRDGQRYPFYYPSVASVQDYVDAVTGSAWFRRRWGLRRIRVTHAKGGTSHGGYGNIDIAVRHRRSEAVILHEIAHNLTPFTHAYHGPEFAAVVLTLVKHQMGAAHAATLRAAFAEHRVKYRAGMAVVPKPSEVRRTEADQMAKARGVAVPRSTRAKAAKAAPLARVQKPMTYEQSYESGWRTLSATNPSERVMHRPGFDADAWEDGWLDQAAGREKWHMRECRNGNVPDCTEHDW